MKTRAITGFFFIIIMICSTLFGHYPFGIFYLILSLLCLNEFYGLVKQSGFKPNIFSGVINAVIIYTVFAFITYQGTSESFKYLLILTITISTVFCSGVIQKVRIAVYKYWLHFMRIAFCMYTVHLFSCPCLFIRTIQFPLPACVFNIALGKRYRGLPCRPQFWPHQII